MQAARRGQHTRIRRIARAELMIVCIGVRSGSQNILSLCVAPE
jgi:hypothetical protein